MSHPVQIPHDPAHANRAVWEKVDHYFWHAGTDPAENALSARPDIDFWKSAGGAAAFAWVVERLETVGRAMTMMVKSGMSEELIHQRIFEEAQYRTGQMSDILTTFGREAGGYLVSRLAADPDEDERALMAFLLARDFVSTFDESQRNAARACLEDLAQETVGTSCRMALAWAACKLGSKAMWESLAFGDYVTTAPDPAAGRILEFLALDIASNGMAFAANPQWTRRAKGPVIHHEPDRNHVKANME